MLRHLNGYLLLCFSIVKNHPIKKTVTCILDRDIRLIVYDSERKNAETTYMFTDKAVDKLEDVHVI